MLKMISLSCLLTTILLTATNLYANDSAFGGTGAAPMPIKKTSVRMVDEYIQLHGVNLHHKNLGGAWKVNCLFTFRNMTNKSITLNMGFPFPVRDEFGAVAIPAGYKAKVGEPLIYNFSVWINGKRVATKRSKITKNPKYGLHYQEAYLWHMTFAPNQIIKIQHQYLMGINTNVFSQTFVPYILKTGGLWHGGKIGHTKIVVTPNVPTRLCREVDTQARKGIPPSLAGMKIVGTKEKRKYIWNLYNFKPTQDLDLCLQTGRDYVRARFIYPLLSKKLHLKKLTPEKLRILRNTIYAQYGRTFKNTKLQTYFNRQWWYAPNPNYYPSMLNKDDHKAISLINREEYWGRP